MNAIRIYWQVRAADAHRMVRLCLDGGHLAAAVMWQEEVARCYRMRRAYSESSLEREVVYG
jgi:hypothetical protein